MFADVGNGVLINLDLVARVHLVNLGAAGSVVKFYSPSNELLADFAPPSPEELDRVMAVIHAHGRGMAA
jgi:hypothetical protein